MPSAEKVPMNAGEVHQLQTSPPQSSGSRPSCPAHSHRPQISQMVKHPLPYINRVTFNWFTAMCLTKGGEGHYA